MTKNATQMKPTIKQALVLGFVTTTPNHADVGDGIGAAAEGCAEAVSGIGLFHGHTHGAPLFQLIQ